MPNTILFVMSKGKKPGDTPSIANTNVYYDCPTNPLIICDGALLDSGVYVNDAGGFSSGTQTYIDVDDNSGGDAPIVFKEGDSVYDDTGTLVGVVIDFTNNKITLAANNAVALADNEQLKSTYKLTTSRIACYEIRKKTTDASSNPPSSTSDGGSTGNAGNAQYGVSYSTSFQVLNRQYPDRSTCSSVQETNGYLENRENTPSYRIEMDIDSDSDVITLPSTLIDTYDYFVMLFVDEPKKHHFAKITEITTSDVVGDSFEFTPAYNSDIPKGTKFAIYKGPIKTDTEVVAVGYGLAGAGSKYTTDADETDGTGTAKDTRHSEMTYVARPNFYFYNDKLDKENQLDHNTKYMLHYSRSDPTASEQTFQRSFTTTEDYGKRIVDYSKYSLNIDLVDNLKTYDTINSSAVSTEHYDGTQIPYTANVSDWNDCFLNNLRNEDDDIFSASDQTLAGTDDFIGPTRYLHYTASPQKVTSVPHIIDLDLFESITKTGTYMSLTLADPKRIYSKKIKRDEKISIYKTLDNDVMTENYTAAFFGTVTGTTSSTTLTFAGLEDGQDLRLLLRSASNYDTIRIGKYNYRITAVGAPSGSAATQTITIDAYKLTTAGSWTTSISGAAETITAQIAYRRAWSPITKTLMVDFNIDTIANYSGTSVTTVVDNLVTLKQGNTTISYTDSKLYKTQICLLSGPQNGLRFPVKYGDQKNAFLKIDIGDTEAQQLYLAISATRDVLSYYSGNFTLEKKIFQGYAENIEDYIEEGQYKIKIQGRNEISKLLGPLVNKNYTYSEDIIYSSLGPFIHYQDSTYHAIVIGACRTGSNTLTATSGTLAEVGDLIFATSDANTVLDHYGPITVGNFVGEVSAVSGASFTQTITLLDGVLCRADAFIIIRTNRNYSFAKAMEHTSYASQTPTSLDSTSSKGLFFTGGKTIIMSTGAEDINLIGTSIDNHGEAIGYPIYNPRSISTGHLNRKNGDSSFLSRLSGWGDAEFDVPNAIPNFIINEVEENKGKGIINLAPISPIVLARSDIDISNVDAEILTDSGLSFTSAKSVANMLNANTHTKWQFNGDIDNAVIDKVLYTVDGNLLGKIAFVYYPGGTASSPVKKYFLLDRTPLDSGITSLEAGDKIYEVTSRVNTNISFLNTQGINNGAVLQLMNHTISKAGNTLPFNHQIKHNNTVTDAYGDMDFIQKFGGFNFRVYDIHHFNPGTIYKSKRKYAPYDGSGVPITKNIYSHDTGKLQGFGKSYRMRPLTQDAINTHGSIIIPEWDSTQLNKHMTEKPPDMKNLEPIFGSNFEDYDKYAQCQETAVTVNGALDARANVTITVDGTSPVGIFDAGTHVYNSSGEFLGVVRTRTTTTVVCYDVIENAVVNNTKLWINANKFLDTAPNMRTYPLSFVYPKLYTLNNVFDWANNPIGTDVSSSNASGERGFVLNSIVRSRDYMEVLDPKCTKYYLYGQSDLYPDCAKRKHSLFYGTRTLQNYNLLLKSKGKNEESITPDGYTGLANRKILQDSSYETVAIESGDKSLSDLKRFNLLRLTELAFDCHFNMVDAENPPPKKSGISHFKYSTFNVVEPVAGGPYITGYETNRTIIAYTGDDTNLSANDYLFTYDGIFLGQIGSINKGTDKITLASTSSIWGDKANYGSNGYEYKGPIFKVPYGTYNNSAYGHLEFDMMGRAGQDTISGTSGQQKAHPINLMQGAFKNGSRNQSDDFQDADVNTDSIMYPVVGVAYLNTDMNITFNGVNSTSDATINTNEATAGLFHRGDAVYDGTTYLGKVSHTTGNTIELRSNSASVTVNTNNARKYESIFGNSIGRHPSKIFNHIKYAINDIQDPASPGGVTENGPFCKNRVIVIERYSMPEEGGSAAPNAKLVGIGQSTSIIEGGLVNKSNCKTGGNLHNQVWMSDMKIRFASFSSAGADIAPSGYFGDGVYSIYKPILYMAGIQPGVNGCRKIDDSYKKDGSTPKNTLLLTISNFHLKTQGNMANVFWGSSESIGTNRWLDYAPNLTGYYLVSSAGTYTDADDGSTLTDANVGSGAAYSSAEISPDSIHYIISHTKQLDTDGQSGVIHHILIDNCMANTSTDFDNSNFRVMRPAEICIHKETPNTIPLYTMSSSITKEPYSNKMYSDIPSHAYVNVVKLDDGSGTVAAETYHHTRRDKNTLDSSGSNHGRHDYDEAILSMYILIDPDNASDSEYLEPRTPSDLFGDKTTSKVLKDGTYPFTLTDGNKTITTNVTFQSSLGSTVNNKNVTATFSDTLPELIGAVSLGTPFTITSPKPIELKNAHMAKIGATVTICQEAEDIIEDILETNNITYTDSTIEYPKYMAPNFQGIDLFTASNYLAKLKEKRLTVDVDTIKLEKTHSNIRHLPIEISDKNSDNINLISIKKKSAAFDFYNHITVYGRGVKSTARNPSSIKSIGKKSFENFDDKLTTETEVNKKARGLLAAHSNKNQTIEIETTIKGLEHLQAGDIIILDLPRENIKRDVYMVLQIHHSMIGKIVINLSSYSKSIDVRLAELLSENKKVAAYLRGDRFKGNTITNELVDSIKIKNLKLLITKTITSSTGTFIGFNTVMNLGTYTMGFTGLGQTTTTLLERDL